MRTPCEVLHYNVETVGDYVEPGREGGGGERRRWKEEGEVPTIPFEDEPSPSTGLYFRNGPLPADTISLTSEEGQTASNVPQLISTGLLSSHPALEASYWEPRLRPVSAR